MKKVNVPTLIHAFAALHVATTLLCAWAGFPDSLLLTVLTMTMIVLICRRRDLTVEFTAINVILVNIFGFILGNLGAQLFRFHPEVLGHAVATFATTEILGWGLDLFARSFLPAGRSDDRRVSWQRDLGWLVFAVVVVFSLRVFIDYTFRGGLFRGTDIIGQFVSFLNNALVLILMIGLTLLFIRYGHRKKVSLDVATLGTTLFIGAISAAAALFHTLGLPFGWKAPPDPLVLARNIVVAALVELTFFTVSYFVLFAVHMREEMIHQKEKRHRAEFRYMALKHQVNPHFLFNSLNILDSLVQDGASEEASAYIHKLAGIYRYLLQHEGETLVRLSEEVAFARQYRELLQIRFPEGFVVENRIREEDLGRYIVPCTLQLLLENATKHNAISASDPLTVRLSSDGSTLTMENNVIPKVSPAVSTGVGLQYIRQQYLDLSGSEVYTEKTGGRFLVRLPLLQD